MDASRSDRTGLAAQDWPVPTSAKTAATHAGGESEGDARREGSWMGEHMPKEEGATTLAPDRLTYLTYIRPTTGIIVRHSKHIHHPDLQIDRRPSQTNQTNADQPDQDLPARTYENTTNIRPTTGIIVRHSKHIRHPGLQTDHKPLEHLPTNQTKAYQPEHLIAYAYTNQIEGKICVYQPDRVPRPTHICYCMKGQCIIQQQHGHYTDLDPNGFRTGDDWPD